MNNVNLRTYKDIVVNRREVFGYMSCRTPDVAANELLDRCIEECRNILSYKVCYSCFDISLHGDEIDLGFEKVKSHALSLNLKGCEKAVVFAATVGHGIDRAIKKEALVSASKSLCLQALGSERVESLCNVFNEEMRTEYEKIGLKLKPRFSPGYGDLSLEIQRSIISTLECSRLIGIDLGENLMMSPSKSVTAIIGLRQK